MVNSQAPITGEDRVDCWEISYGFGEQYGDGIVFETGRKRMGQGGGRIYRRINHAGQMGKKNVWNRRAGSNVRPDWV